MEAINVGRSGSDLFSVSIDRRNLLRKMAGAGVVVAAAGVGLTLTQGSASADAAFYQTTSALNLRSGPGPRRRVILVIPSGAGVESYGKSKNGYRYVGYNGIAGWAHSDYLTATDDIAVPTVTGTATTTTSVNMRNQPSTSASVYRVLPEGTTVDVFDVWENGFRKVGFAQVSGWVHADYLAASGGPLGGYVVTTTALNLRAEANTTSKVLVVMPKGAKAFRGDVIANGFLGVTYNGKSGWAHMDFLENA